MANSHRELNKIITISYDNGVTIEWSDIFDTNEPQLYQNSSDRSDKIILEDPPEEEKKVENKHHKYESYAEKAVKSTKHSLQSDKPIAVSGSIVASILIWKLGGLGYVLAQHGYTKYKQQCADNTFQKKEQYNNKVQSFNDKLNAVRILETAIKQQKDELVQQEEKFNTTTFAVERCVKDSKVIVAIGPTGFGKSLFCNRMIGNQNDTETISESENMKVAPIYTVAAWGDANAKTTEIQKEIRQIKMGKKTDDSKYDIDAEYNLSVVDTPGAFDTDDNDKHFQNQMGEYFRACGGVNMFCIFFRFGGKKNSNFRRLLKDYEEFWGGEFWEHCVIIITNCDIDKGGKNKQKLENKLLTLTIPQIKEFLNEVSNGKCKRCDGKDIPIFCFGKNNYNDSTCDILETIAETHSVFAQKYTCQNIVSPMDKLWEELKTPFDKYKRLLTELKNLQKDIETLKVESNVQNK